MTRFLRLHAPDPKGLPGERFRLEIDPDLGPTLHHERVLSGHELNRRAVIRETFSTTPLDASVVDWFCAAFGELQAELARGEAPTIDGQPLAEAEDMDSDATQPMGVDGKFDGRDRSKR